MRHLLPLPPRKTRDSESASTEDLSKLPFAKERREFILRQLYDSMQKSEEPFKIEFDPDKNGNCLFSALQEGLKRVRPEAADVHSLSIGAFRTRLMEHLRGSISEINTVRCSGRYDLPSFESHCACQWKHNVERRKEAGVAGDLPAFSIENYLEVMKEDAEEKCFWGGLVEVKAFAHLCCVNVVIVEEDSWELVEYSCVDDGVPTIIMSFDGNHYRLLDHIGGTEDDHEYWNKENFDEEEVDLYRPCRISEEESSGASASFFYSLLQGLADVTALCPNKTSVSELKTDFHAYSNANPTKAFEGVLLREYDIDTLARGGDAAVLNWVAREKGVTVARYTQSDGSFVRERVFEGTCLVFSRLCGCCDWRRLGCSLSSELGGGANGLVARLSLDGKDLAPTRSSLGLSLMARVLNRLLVIHIFCPWLLF
jgi:hypothetical protein